MDFVTRKKRGSLAEVLPWLLVAILFSWAVVPETSAFTLRVTDPGGQPVSGFSWLLEVDNTHSVDPGAHIGPVRVRPGAKPEPNPLALSVHRSHAPTVLSGSSATHTATIEFLADGVTRLPRGRYIVSVLPYTGYTMGGRSLELPADGLIRVFVTPHPIATAQISIKVFHDIKPTNNTLDVGESGLAGFSVLLFDTFGQVTMDAFGNPLGTTYRLTCDDTGKNPGTGKQPCLRNDGSPIVDVMAPNGFEILSNAAGEARIKFIPPGKYGIQVVPPPGQGWHQTTTIEGTPTIDAWVRPNEPPFLVEFGPPFWHAFYGFVQDFNNIPPPLPGQTTAPITGQVLKGHLSRPPAITFHAGAPPSTSPCLVALNVIGAATNDTIYAGQCGADGFFTIPDVPSGLYQLVVWDTFLDMIMYFTSVSVPDGAAVGAIPVPMWFAEQEHYVFGDTNANGFRDPGEVGIPDQNVNLRFRDGSVYQTFPTDATGYVPFEQVFPFFKWQVAEVDFATMKATGLTVVVDDGGPVTTDEFGEGKRTPQVQATDGSDPDNEGTDPRYRLQTGPVLTQAYQNFSGQNLRFEWGKTAYGRTENGGISGIVRYATTRAEENPALAAPDNWEPGIPRVQVNLYEDRLDNQTRARAPLGDGVPDDRNRDGRFSRPDVDNHPLGFSECTDSNNDGVGDGGCRAAGVGPEDVDQDGDGLFDLGDAVRFAHTDSWDDNLPSGCRGDVEPVTVHGRSVPISDCAEGLRTWNQVRPGVFDGGYAFGPNVTGDPADPPLRAGSYIVEAVAPPGYEHQKEEDVNVVLGDRFKPSIEMLPPQCVGDSHVVPPYLSLQSDDAGNPLPGIRGVDLVPAPYAGRARRLCDRKQLFLSRGQNGAADFYLFTKVPKAARVVGLLTDDLANELAPGKPAFTEKFSPGWIPLSVTDYSGRQVLRFYSDEFGAYNALVPSTWNVHVPIPTGVSPMMHHICLNHPGPIADGRGGFMTDPQFKRQYSTTCYNFDFWPAKTTYLDTPIVRIAAFIGPLQQSLDCEFPGGTPVIQQVINNANGYPAFARPGQSFTITSVGVLDNIPNPAYPGTDPDGAPADPPLVPQFISRDYGFGGAEGRVRVGTYTFPPSAVTWSDGAITVSVPSPRPPGLATGQLTVVRADGTPSRLGLTLQVGLEAGASIIHVTRGGSIQAAVDAAADGDLILVDPGIYHQNVIVYKNVRIQGAGTSTVIDAKHFPGTALQAWRKKMARLNAAGLLGLLPGQDPTFQVQEGPGFLVVPRDGVFTGSPKARIDGFTIVGADLGGGILVNAYAYDLQLGNNRILNNQGTLGGGVRVGNPSQTNLGGVPQNLPPSPNDRIRIHHNQIIENGSHNYGGGVAIYGGANGYRVENNTVCGNLSRWGGGGLSHRGLSDGGRIASNDFLFNEVFQGNEIGG
ncbi:MAG TPA: SdrD B-like domain-containing protein, partial [Candidatus Methanoperedens sp.]|nr:SdrD B-like domain-containing protein [Candidatus Methanoperedens sp.]